MLLQSGHAGIYSVDGGQQRSYLVVEILIVPVNLVAQLVQFRVIGKPSEDDKD
jgi:hypothetical protein